MTHSQQPTNETLEYLNKLARNLGITLSEDETNEMLFILQDDTQIEWYDEDWSRIHTSDY